MIILLEIHSSLKEIIEKKGDKVVEGVIDLQEEYTVGEFLDELQIPTYIAKMVLVDGKLANLEMILIEGNKVKIVPQMIGG